MSTAAEPRPLLIAVLGIGVLAGAGATYLALAPRRSVEPQATVAVRAPVAHSPEISVTLSQTDVVRANIVLTPVETATLGEAVTVPAVVEPNAYKQTAVTAIVAGRVTRVLAELGQHVRRGQPLAELYSPELADAQRTYISAAAALAAHEQQLARVDGLVAIGSASRQELETAHAEHAAMTTSLEQARTRLELIGLTTEQVASLSAASPITATTEVRAPLDGVVTIRQANIGENVEGTRPLFTVTDLSSVWVVGDLYERDFAKVSVGRPAAVTVSGFPDLALRSTVGYIDPQLNLEARTAKVRVEVQNGQQALRLGMYAQIHIEGAGNRVMPVIPKTAVQTIGDHAVVYVADPGTPGRFVERSIQTGPAAGDLVAVESGVAVGDSVASTGSFFLRAERERQGQSSEAPPTSASLERPAGQARQTARVTVSEKGFDPPRLMLKAGIPAAITFVRTADTTCGTSVVFPSLNMRQELPLNADVTIELTPSHGEVVFTCGAGMYKGIIAAE